MSEVAILMATFNGEKFLAEQLASIRAQSFKNWKIFISDDGSTDATLDIIQSFKDKCDTDQVRVFHGPQSGFARNFISLVKNKDINADFFAFCDQDDIWCERRLHGGLEKLTCNAPSVPLLYCSRTNIMKSNGNCVAESKMVRRPLSFGNAIVQNIGGGNTMLFNQKTRSLLCQLRLSDDLVSHDWLTYIIVSGVGGRVFWDHKCTVNYRQHNGNLVGANMSIAAMLRRFCNLLRGQLGVWRRANLQALAPLETIFLPKNREIITLIQAIDSKPFLKRLKIMSRSKIYRQSHLETAALWIAVILNKF